MTDFPEVLEIHVINSKDKKPIEGITLFVHLFANRKNDYWLLSDYSDKNGVIKITKQMMNDEIKQAGSMFIMDYSSNLENCKSYIEIIAESGISVSDRIKAI